MTNQNMNETDAPTNAIRDALANKVKDGSLGFIGDVVKFTGEVHFKSMLRIDGNFSGQIHSPEGTLIISSSGQVTDAVINVATAMIQGTVNGDVTASKRVELSSSAKVTGTLSAGTLVMQEGAIFDGNCKKI
ncbi:MAG: polymer-forming cytoskeletal protein [Pyrinomonadaceae bacterium]